MVHVPLPLKTNSRFESIEELGVVCLKPVDLAWKYIVSFNICIQRFENQCFLGHVLILVQWHSIPVNDGRINAILFNKNVPDNLDILKIILKPCDKVFFLYRKCLFVFLNDTPHSFSHPLIHCFPKISYFSGSVRPLFSAWKGALASVLLGLLVH